MKSFNVNLFSDWVAVISTEIWDCLWILIYIATKISSWWLGESCCTVARVIYAGFWRRRSRGGGGGELEGGPHTVAHLHIHGRGIGSSWYPSTDLLMISPFSSLLLISLHVLPIFPTCSKITFLKSARPLNIPTPHSLYPRFSLDLLQSWRYQRKPIENILVMIILFVILTKSTIFSFMFLITPDLILTTVDLIMITMIFMMGIILRRGSNC